jgi:hypothetical protein
MKALLSRRRNRRVAALALGASLTLLTASPLFAQEVPGGQALAAYLALVTLMIAIPMYVWWAFATQMIARKTHTENGWLAWIPIANLILWANIARKPVWWGLLCAVPIVGMVFMALLWVAIAKERHKPGWWGILSIVPVVGLIVPAYLALSE